jgi:predicted RND superfamily exporter protein
VLPPRPPGITADVVGLPVAAARGYELVSKDRYLPNLLGILGAALVLLVGLRRRADALRAVVAASLATGWGLAAAWLIGLSLTPLTVGLGSLTVATACEFTVLLGHAGTRSRLRRTVGVAALSAAMGYLSLAMSHLGVIREFGLLLAGVVALSLLAAQLVQVLLPPATAPAAAVSEAPIPTRVEVQP